MYIESDVLGTLRVYNEQGARHVSGYIESKVLGTLRVFRERGAGTHVLPEVNKPIHCAIKVDSPSILVSICKQGIFVILY